MMIVVVENLYLSCIYENHEFAIIFVLRSHNDPVLFGYQIERNNFGKAPSEILSFNTKMTLAVFVLVFVCLESIAVTSFESQHYTDENHQRSDLNELACPYETTCVPVNYCPDVESLMNHNAVSIHR